MAKLKTTNFVSFGTNKVKVIINDRFIEILINKEENDYTVILASFTIMTTKIKHGQSKLTKHSQQMILTLPLLHLFLFTQKRTRASAFISE